jgi:hypothetical protein
VVHPFFGPVLGAVGAAALSMVVPHVVFHRPGKKDLLQDCNALAQRFSFVSVIVSIAIWVVWARFTPGPLNDVVLERVAFALQLELVPALFYVVCIVRVAILRSKDVTAVLGQRTGTSKPVELAIRT